MIKRKLLTVIFVCCVFFGSVFGDKQKYRLCVVNGKGEHKRSLKYCPSLDQSDSPVECVVGLDRLDCLRRVHKNKADFAVFTAEDLVTATNSKIEILITNELRYEKDNPYEYEVVAVMSDDANIKTKHDLRYKRFCHPGYGYEADWTRILSNYFENTIIPLQCNPQLSITENRIRASSEYFVGACKAGPWVNNEVLDYQLKQKYRNLCHQCGNPSKCSTQDSYWGRRGSLLCLTDGSGDISWARLDDVRQHFGLDSGVAVDSPDYYSFLCPDDSVVPINSSRPCVWTVKPWSVVASRRPIAQEIQTIVSSLNYSNNNTWQLNLLHLLEAGYVNVVNLDPVESIETYFIRAKGFLEANSFSACHLPRTIRICATSNTEFAKCAWLRESAAVYGIEPDLECLKADNTTHCMQAVKQNAVDVVMVGSDLVATGIRDYNLTTLFYETVHDEDKYISVAVTRKNTNLHSFGDLKGAKACFPVYDGVAWHSALKALQDANLISSCNSNKGMAEFFGDSCTPGISKNETENLWKLCAETQDSFRGDRGALHCLSSEMGDVAFVNFNVLHQYESEIYPHRQSDFHIICQPPTKPCHLSWAPVGQAMIRSNSTKLWIEDTLNVFLQLDALFGKNFKDVTPSFSMFGPYDGQNDILFHDATVKLRDVPTVRNTDHMKPNFEDVLKSERLCSRGNNLGSNIIFIFLTFVVSRKLVL